MRVAPAVNEHAKAPIPRGLFSPAPLAAIFILLLNDHVLKGAQVLPSWLTGKLSDVAGLFFFPVLLVELAARIGGIDARARSRHTLIVASIATALVFTAIKTIAPINAMASSLLGAMVLDPTDLVALPSTVLATFWMSRAGTGLSRMPAVHMPRLARVGELVTMLSAAFASIATSAIHYPPCHTPEKQPPRLALSDTCVTSDGAHVTLQGGSARVVIVLRAQAGACEVGAESLAFEYDVDGAHAIVHVPTPTAANVQQETTLDLPVPLPYPTHCKGLATHFELRLDARLELPIAGCTEGT